MSTVSKPDAPPAVQHLRETLRDSALGRFVRRHKNAAAAVAGLVGVWKVGRWFLPHWDDLLDHWPITLLVCAVLFATVTICARLGIDWFDVDEDKPSTREPGYIPRRPDHSATHIPRGGG